MRSTTGRMTRSRIVTLSGWIFIFGTLPVRLAAQMPGPVGAYGLNQGAGTLIADQSGNGITGTAQNTSWTSAGKYGGALSFNGSSSYVDLGNPPALQITGSMTWSAWVQAK